MHCDFDVAEDSEDEKEDHKSVRQQRQAASKAASKQREMLMGDAGSEEEQEEEDEAPFQESACRALCLGRGCSLWPQFYFSSCLDAQC